MNSHWPRLPISELCLAIVDCVNRTATTVDGPTPYRMIRTTNVRGGFIDLSNVNFVDEAVYQRWTRRQVPKRGDIVLTREAPLGEVGLVRDDTGIFLGQRLVSYRVNPALADERYLLYTLLGSELQGQIQALGSGSTVEHMRVPDAKRLLIPTPPLSVQQRIGSILGAYDELIEVNRQRIALLEEMARRLFEEWFVRFRFPGYKSHAMVETPDGLLPEGWRGEELDGLCVEVRDTVSPADVENDTPYVGLEHIPRRSTTLDAWGHPDEVTSTKHRFRAGDVLFGKIRPYFHKVVYAPFDGVCSSDAIVIRSRRPEWTGIVLGVTSSDRFVAQAVATSNGTKMPRANWSVLSRTLVPMPADDLVNTFNKTIVSWTELAASLHNATIRLAASRHLLLPRLISGELPVSTAERELKAVA